MEAELQIKHMWRQLMGDMPGVEAEIAKVLLALTTYYNLLLTTYHLPLTTYYYYTDCGTAELLTAD